MNQMSYLKDMDQRKWKVKSFDDVFETENQIKKCIVFGFRVFIGKLSNCSFLLFVVICFIECHQIIIGCILKKSCKIIIEQNCVELKQLIDWETR